MVPSIAQLVERWTVEEIVIHRSLVRIRLEGLFFFFFPVPLVFFFFLMVNQLMLFSSPLQSISEAHQASAEEGDTAVSPQMLLILC